MIVCPCSVLTVQAYAIYLNILFCSYNLSIHVFRISLRFKININVFHVFADAYDELFESTQYSQWVARNWIFFSFLRKLTKVKIKREGKSSKQSSFEMASTKTNAKEKKKLYA